MRAEASRMRETAAGGGYSVSLYTNHAAKGGTAGSFHNRWSKPRISHPKRRMGIISPCIAGTCKDTLQT